MNGAPTIDQYWDDDSNDSETKDCEGSVFLLFELLTQTLLFHGVLRLLVALRQIRQEVLRKHKLVPYC